MSHVYAEPQTFAFRDVNGHHGKKFNIDSRLLEPLIIDCEDRMTASLCEHEVERLYYVISGNGYFVIDNENEAVKTGDLVFIPAGSTFTFGGQLKMLLVDAPHWSPEQEEILE